MKTLSLLVAAAVSSLFIVPAAQAAPPREVAATTTRVTFRVASCDGCTLSLASYLEGSMDVWTSKTKEVEDGLVTFRVPTERTFGLSVMVRAPWEGASG